MRITSGGADLLVRGFRLTGGDFDEGGFTQDFSCNVDRSIGTTKKLAGLLHGTGEGSPGQNPIDGLFGNEDDRLDSGGLGRIKIGRRIVEDAADGLVVG